jgi:hypothetical protein
MRDLSRSCLAIFLAVAFLFTPASWAADSSAAGTATPATTAATAAPTAGPSLGAGTSINPTLVDLLVKKGIISTSEANSLRNASGSAGMDQLLLLLKSKGLVSDSEVNDLKTASESDSHALYDAESAPIQSASLTGGQTKPPEPKPTGPTVIPAIAPVRVLPLDPPAKDALIPGLKLGAVKLTPYGFIKATEAYDSLSPYGDDWPKPGFLTGASDTGPTKNPEWHMKARSTRIGSKFEWPDISKNVTVTGQVEGDFEGNFSAVDNRNVSTIRSNGFQLRLAFGRIDWTVNPNSDVFFEAGQDWTIFGSSALMNLFETTFYGAYWGNLYERSPQMRVGLVQKLGGSRNWKFSPEFAIMMPSEGDLPASSVKCTVEALGSPTTCTFVNGLASQIGYGERQGADNAKPTLESRVVLQFQLDNAPGVVPAQILWSGFYSGRQMTVLGSAVPTCPTCAGGIDEYKAAFPTGVDIHSNGYGNQIALSLPTRWATVVASGYMGSDLRFFFAGQTLSYYNRSHGLTNIADGFSVDNNPALFGTNAAGQAVVASQLPVRGYGGFVQLGLPLSRWFNAEPKGRNAGWQAYFEYGLDAANANDFYLAKGISATAGAGPIKSSIKAATVFYKMSPWVQFGFEQSNYSSYAVPTTLGICTTKVAGKGSCTSTDWRSEFGPVFTF